MNLALRRAGAARCKCRPARSRRAATIAVQYCLAGKSSARPGIRRGII